MSPLEKKTVGAETNVVPNGGRGICEMGSTNLGVTTAYRVTESQDQNPQPGPSIDPDTRNESPTVSIDMPADAPVDLPPRLRATLIILNPLCRSVRIHCIPNALFTFLMDCSKLFQFRVYSQFLCDTKRYLVLAF